MRKGDKLQGQADINSILQKSANKVICQVYLLLVPWKYKMNRNKEWTEWHIGSVHFSSSVVSDFLRPHESQHARPPCPSTTPGVHSNSRPSSRWFHPAISSSIVPFSSSPQSLPASESSPMSHSLYEVAKLLEFQL